MDEQSTIQFFLASASPRRSELLQQLQYRFEVYPVNIDESRLVNEAPKDYVSRLAEQKATAAFKWLDSPAVPVLGADTIVVLDDQVMGKPKDKAQACEMWAALSGSEHLVMTAVALVAQQRTVVRLNQTKVRFRHLSINDMDAYWASGEPKDKAGAYAIQGLGSVFVETIQGSYSAVVGLPLFETAQLLEQFGISVW